MKFRFGAKKIGIILGTLAMMSIPLLPLTAQATSYTWTGTTSNAWNLNTNWGGSGPPNSYSDQATIPSAGANRPVTLSTTALLGVASGNALTISGASSGATSNSLDISSTGTLGMQGGISIGSRRTLTIEGTLRNDAASSATNYTISGSPILNGGTISSLNGGGWNLSNGVNGYGTISAPVVLNGGTISANVANQTLHITGDVTSTSQRGLGGGSTLVSGALLSIEGGNIYGGTATGGLEGGITNYNRVNLRGNFNNIQLFNDGAYNGATPGDWNYYNLTGNSSWKDGALNIINFNGYKMDVTGSVTNYASSGNGINVGTGTLNNSGTTGTITSITNGNLITLGGGSITNTGGGTFNIGSQINGYGNVSGVTNINSGAVANGGLLTIVGGTGTTVSGAGLGANSGATLDLKGNFTFTSMPGLFPGNGGVVQLDGATITGNGISSNPMYISGNSAGTGITKAVSSSSLSGQWNNINTVEIGKGTQLTITPGTGNNFSSSGKLQFDIGGLNSFGVLNIKGSALITGGTIDFDFVDGFTGAPGCYDFFFADPGFTWSSSLTYEFDNLASDLTATVVQLADGTGEELQITGSNPVPEPSTLLLLGSGLVGLVAYRRKFKKA